MVPRPKHIEYDETFRLEEHDNQDHDPLGDNSSDRPKHLVLIGGGHAHVQVIKALSARPAHRLHVTLIDQQPAASYSGMVPGCLAKLYTAEQTLLQLEPLAQWANLSFLHRTVVDIYFDQKLIYTTTVSKQEN